MRRASQLIVVYFLQIPASIIATSVIITLGYLLMRLIGL